VSSMLSNFFGLFVTFFVPAVVWSMLIAGSYQLVREGFHQIQVTLRESQRLESYRQQIG